MRLTMIIGFGVIAVASYLLLRTARHEVGKEKTSAAQHAFIEKESMIQDKAARSGAIERDSEASKVKDYYADLPDLDSLILSLSSLEDDEIDRKIATIESRIKTEKLVDRANSKDLDDAGFRRLAALMQESDALYSIKITRQVEEAEKGFDSVTSQP